MPASSDPEDAIAWPETLTEALRELNTMGSFETGPEKQGHLSAGPSGLPSRPGTGLFNEKWTGGTLFPMCGK